MRSVVVNNTLHVNFLSVKTVYWTVLAFLCLFFLIPKAVTAQKVYTSDVISYSPNFGVIPPIIRVLDPTNATADNGLYARLKARGEVLGLVGGYNSYLELGYTEAVPANTPSYIRIGGDPDLLEALLGGTLGDALIAVLGGVLGNQVIEVRAYDEVGTTVFSGDSRGGFDANNLRLLQGKDGDYYLRIIPDHAYKSIEVKNIVDGLLAVLTTFHLDVYHAFYFEEQCNYSPEFVSYSGDGINLDVLDLGGGIVEHPEYAMDDDLSTSASIGPGLINLVGSYSSQFHFTQGSSPTDEVMVTLSGDPSLLNVDVLNSVSFQAYDGDDLVFEQDLGALSDELLGLIDLDILGLLGDGTPVTFPVSPDVSFDRFEITVGAVVGVDVGEALNVHEVARTVGMPEFGGATGNQYSVCEGQSLSVSPQHYGGAALRWYDTPVGGTSIGATESLDIAEVTEDQTYYVSSIDHCNGEEIESARVAVGVEALAVPQVEDYGGLPSQAEYGVGEAVILEPVLEAGTGIEDPQFSWSLSPTGAPVIADEVEVDKGDHTVTYRLRPDGALEIEGLMPEDEIEEVYLALQNGVTGCKAIQAVDQVYVILPVSWKRFDGMAQNKENRLEWEFFTPQPLWRLSIQRANESLKWYDIGEMELSPDVMYGGAFSFVDESPYLGANYYRIKAEKMDGSKAYSKVIRLDLERQVDEVFDVYPNPVVGIPVLRNQTTKDLGQTTVQVYDQHGGLVDRFSLDQLLSGEAVKLDQAKPLHPGVYIYTFYTQGHVQRIKVIW
ncbi:T9SS type A sorting domain-containing protein [Echinicola vietnamensis]|uniref:Ig-like domain-containing protein n=1 Tax=Echinicola vietnamensis (strain DSM 17526 / LMG 23754 / KMM 6221) TaxID=926556 RepID=L0FWW5_ECHVK|nr:T9SS type A sorting domain-containing protein [Echinicola vietnamensis]AGA78404.1 hypothetical protein Echvi_2153 [Echinicola vietnamensis DSM 17526]